MPARAGARHALGARRTRSTPSRRRATPSRRQRVEQDAALADSRRRRRVVDACGRGRAGRARGRRAGRSDRQSRRRLPPRHRSRRAHRLVSASEAAGGEDPPRHGARGLLAAARRRARRGGARYQRGGDYRNADGRRAPGATALAAQVRRPRGRRSSRATPTPTPSPGGSAGSAETIEWSRREGRASRSSW
ncbi:MAG: hypothetical protein MZV70_43395 [Desulfobacterales bacterium]|nr:hypothetical protein [Desulfobacterales bacterium]